MKTPIVVLCRTLLLVPFLLAHPCTGRAAELTFAGIFSDHMVLQRDMPVSVWGGADAGETVTIEFDGQKKTTTADSSGKWIVKLDPLTAATEARTLVARSEKENRRVEVNDVLVGEVWLCAGQSNMEWALSKSDGGAEAIASSANPMLRMCRVPHNVQMTPQSEVAAKWEECLPDKVKGFSAIPYWFGSKLQKALGVPVGIINNSFGGTTIQSWMPEETLKKGPWPQDKWTVLALAKEDYDRRVAEARPLKEKYEAEKAEALAKNLPAPPQPAGIPSEFKGVSTLWNGEVVPLLPYSIRGVAWYQGENNAYVKVADTYKDLLPAMIQDWRNAFGQPDLPFLIFQIARNRKWQTDPNEQSGIAQLQEAQLKTVLATPRSALIVTTDMGGPDVHYTGKEPIADRATRAALAMVYGRQIPWAPPVFQKVEFHDGKAVVYFDNAGGGLESRDGSPKGFVIAGADRKFVFADATIEGDKVVVSSPQVPQPAAVRYGWADLPQVNLYNRDGIPASPFRTDDWP